MGGAKQSAMTKPCLCLAVSALALMMGGCQTIVSISQSEIRVHKGKQIVANDETYNILNFLEPQISIKSLLAKQCPGGLVTGVETVLRKREFIILQKYNLSASASCQDAVEGNLKLDP